MGKAIDHTGSSKQEQALGFGSGSVSYCKDPSKVKGHQQGHVNKDVSSEISKMQDMHKVTKMPAAKADVED